MENMKTLVTSAAIAALAAGSAHAGGLDRSGQFLGDLFAEGNVLKFSYGKVTPSIGGADNFAGAPVAGTYDNVGGDYTRVGLSLKADMNEALSFALILDQPFGADILYPGSSATTALGGTSVDLKSEATTLVGRYKFGNGFSVHGGLRSQTLEGTLNLGGVAYGAGYDPTATPGQLNGYSLSAPKSRETGYLIGAAYERPDIALRVALTYNSAIDYNIAGVDSGLTGTNTNYTVKSTTPESWNLEFQTGVAQNTLVFGSIRYTKWGDFDVPTSFGKDLADIDDSTSYNVGVARRFSDQFAGSVSITYESEDGNPLVSPLGPTNGLLGISIGGAYDVSDEITVSAGINYTKVGDASPETAIKAADMTDNSVFGVGFSVAYKF